MSAIYLAGFIQTLFFIILILTKRGKRIYDYFLALYFLVLGMNLFYLHAILSGIYSNHPLVAILDILYWTLLGPSLFLYISLITSRKPHLEKKFLVHLLPTLFVLLAFGPFFFDQSAVYFEEWDPGTWLYKAGFFVWIINSPVYYVICLFKLRKHRKKIKQCYSATLRVDLNWLYFLTHGFALFLFFLLGKYIAYAWFEISFPPFLSHLNWIVLVLYIFGIGFYGYRQKNVFSDLDKPLPGAEDLERETLPVSTLVKDHAGSYMRSGLSDDEAEKIREHLVVFMKNEKPFLDCTLNIRQLADSIRTTPHKLSQVINEKMGYNFYEFVNHYRIEEAKKCLTDPDLKDLKILAIAYDCGFNSKSAFYTIFKKFTTLTPSAYQREELVDSQ